MENVTNFLESSTIHGLAYMASGRRYVRLCWLLVVIGGFTGAGAMIFQSFQSWAESPVKTTIETLPITEIKFPKVTVCPPKNTFTELNYDLLMLKNSTFVKDERDWLTNYAMKLLLDSLHKDIMENITILYEHNLFRRWYHGYTQIKLPKLHYYNRDIKTNYDILYKITASFNNGIISTRYFGDTFDAEKVDKNIYYWIIIPQPFSFRDPLFHDHDAYREVILHFQIEKVSMPNGHEEFRLENDIIKADQRILVKNYTLITNGHNGHYEKTIKLSRKMSLKDAKKMEFDFMPGFQLTWYHTILDTDGNIYSLDDFNKYYNKYIGKEERDKMYKGDPSTKLFVRYGF